MASRRLISLAIPRLATLPHIRQFGHSSVLLALNDRGHANAETHRTAQTDRPLNPHLTNTSSTIANDMPKAGKHSAPPEMLSSVDAEFKPRDGSPENTRRMTGDTQESASGAAGGGAAADGGASSQELNVGEMEGASFKVEPLRRTGEDASTMRARLLYQSRKRGTLESELLMSTFASANLATMSADQLHQYDLFLDENDWDIYYWATQEPASASVETTAEGPGGSTVADRPVAAPRAGEWAQTVGTFKPAYRPVPQRWKESEILQRLRDHVKQKRNDGLGFMPPITHFR